MATAAVDTLIEKPADNQDAILQVLYANFGCFALLTAHKLQIFQLFEHKSLTTAELPTDWGYQLARWKSC